ncbi:MAG: hypothetical protein AAB369_01905 [Chloroflexota bacterium]
MRDAIELGKKGIPTVAMVTERFVNLAQHVAKGQGMPSLPMVVLPANVDFLSPEELRVVADKAFSEVAGKLASARQRKPAV